LREARAVVALVEVEAGLVALGHVELEAASRLARSSVLGGPFAAQPAGGGLPGLRARTPASERSTDRARPVAASSASAITSASARCRRRNCADERVGIAVDDEPRQAVGLAVDQAHAVAVDRQPRAHRDGGAMRRSKKAASMRSASSKLQARTRIIELRAVGAPGEEAAVGGLDTHRLAGIGRPLGHAALEHPGVAAQQRSRSLPSRRVMLPSWSF
jgi:hypothetical protein